MAVIKLLATDLDGTLIGKGAEFHLYEPLCRQISEIRQRHGGVWAICTSRRLGSFHHVFSPMRAMGLTPDFVIARHAYIFRPTRRFGYVPRVFWNIRIAFIQWRLARHANRLVRLCRNGLLDMMPDAYPVRKKPFRFALRFSSEESLRTATRFVQKHIRDFPALKTVRFNNTLALIDIPFTKGLAVAEIARHLDILKDDILTVGNGLNDISMLDGAVSGMTGCPQNSAPEVMKHVSESGGHIAEAPALAGVLDIIRAHQTDHVRSALPDTWQDPTHEQYGKFRTLRSQRETHRTLLFRYVMLWGALLYIVLLVFAHYNLLPFSGVIKMPFNLLLRLIARWTAG